MRITTVRAGDPSLAIQPGSARDPRAVALWARRHLGLWIVLATSVEAASLILVSALISLVAPSGVAISGLVLVLLVLLALSVVLPVAGHVVEGRDRTALASQQRSGQIDRLLVVGSARRPARLSQVTDDQLGATPTRYTMAGQAPYVARPDQDVAIRDMLTAPGPPYPFVIVWGDTKSGKSRTLAEALRAAFIRNANDPVVVVPRDGTALAELSRIGFTV